jgi:hypothetical protein
MDNIMQPIMSIDADGDKVWKLNGKYHREDDPAIEYADGDKEWYLKGKRHRIDGPAIEYANGRKSWFTHGRIHRTDGPAAEYVDGSYGWFLRGGFRLTFEEWLDQNKPLTDEEKVMLKLQYG